MNRPQASSISRRLTLQGSLMLGVAAAFPSALAQGAQAAKIAATIDAAKTGAPITKYMYGGFIEHLGNLINYSYWSEVLDDRKFYHAVNSQPLPAPRGPIPRMMVSRKWMPIGPDAAVVMDTENPYVGEQSPVIRLSGSSHRGIQQSGLTLVKGKTYTGRIVLAADRGAKIKATLIWGKNPGERQSVDIPVQEDWSKAPIAFTAHGDTADGRIEIVGTGSAIRN